MANGQRTYRSGFLRELNKNFPLFLMALPGVVLLIAFSYLPLFGLIIAFKDVHYDLGILKSPWVGLKNFEFLFKTPDAFIITRNTLLYNFAFIVFGNLAAIATAISLSEMRARFMAKFYQSVMFLPYFLSWVVVAYMAFAFLSIDLGILNTMILPKLGLQPIAWYFETKPWPVILILANLWKYTGYNAVIYLAAITGIDPEYYEAALIDGASKWQQIRHITIPLLSPLVVVLVLLGIGRIFYADFGLFYQLPMNSGALFDVTNVIDTYVYRTLMGMNDIGMASAASFYQSIMGFILVLTSNLIVRRLDPEKALF
ncbi:binding-protein-dependent transport systems inner membrane component [Caldicellulosiruptor hydrothermalis 108]|uniref:Binding-protein-dependent transport systems inner membrane component n=1 Tax=Caldicellulosiruptor hydrothermalis (strain DSM 18901 / VKM B-2411 / 108) TaxID=632292 RepID=E4QEF4_CALH1|nr:ABC transporter permease subunit [Caldicellulosiruptor hydrothermalis]ADQ07773.1 binding-protein-dependent transport systems inner membrane component [Caldicellulosiruptor hydrothermalis 108]